MNSARSRENNIQLLPADLLPEFVGHKCALWIARHCADKVQLLRSRNYLPPKTAFYCDWLKFLDEEMARQFLQAWPRYDLLMQLNKVRAQHVELAFKLERDLSIGAYDLGRLPANKRWSAANNYIAAYGKLKKFEWDCKNLELAAELSSTWSTKIDAG